MSNLQGSGGKSPRRASFLWLLTLCNMGIIYSFSSISSERLPALSGGLDKVVHAGVYAILSFLIYHALRESGIRRHLMPVCLLLAFLYAASDEIHQLHVPGRVASWGDLIADAIGVLFGGWFASHLKR